MTETRAVKVFRMNDCDWYAAETLEQAMAECAKDYGYKDVAAAVADQMIDEPSELCDEALDRLKFHREDGTEVSFRERLLELADDAFPQMFASTEY